MTTTWDRVTDIFGAARALDANMRAAFLDAACGSNLTLRARVEQLLRNDVDDGFLRRDSDDGRDDAALFRTPVAVGDVLGGRYVIDEMLGHGGQGLVYRATDRLLARPVVVKVMRTAGRRSAMLRARFEQEKQALARVDHPGVVGILDIGELPDGAPYLVIQYINGKSLRHLLQEGPIARPRAMAILQALAGALSAAHAAGVAHQDLKPENVMLQQLGDGGETVRLIDFGIAKLERSELDPGVTAVTVAGTVRYMAPEQFEGENTRACDVYALGLIACELLCGRPDARALPASMGRRARREIDLALAFHASDRPSDVRLWAAHLAAALDGRSKRAMIIAVVGTLIAAAFAAGIVGARVWDTRTRQLDRVVEKVGAFHPISEGFLTHDNPVGRVFSDPENTRLDGWRVMGSSAAGSYYYHPLTDAQTRAAFTRGWHLDAVMAVEEGSAFALVDFGGQAPRRFDLKISADASGHIVRLQTQLIPDFRGLDVRLPPGDNKLHHYELVFDPALRTASLWIDGDRRIEGYSGHTQFTESTGVGFGVAPFKSASGVGLFRSVRFEINR